MSWGISSGRPARVKAITIAAQVRFSSHCPTSAGSGAALTDDVELGDATPTEAVVSDVHPAITRIAAIRSRPGHGGGIGTWGGEAE